MSSFGRRRRRLHGALLAFAIATFAACGPSAASIVSGPYPDVCPRLDYSDHRCAFVVARAIDLLKIDRTAVDRIELTRKPSPQNNIGNYQGVTVAITLHDGTLVQQDVVCVGVSGGFEPDCGDEAQITLGAAIDHDIPCWPPPSGCAVEPPPPDPAIAAKASPLEVAAIDVPVHHDGHYEIPLGKATLADGYLQELGMRVLDMQPDTYWISHGTIDVRSDVPGRPRIGSRYRDPYDGLEPVSVFLVFDVELYVSPGVVQVRDVVVR